MTDPSLYAKDRSTILIHFYRAMVGRADTWRTRMDATTNWAIVVTAAVISFALGSAKVPHWSLSIASLMTLSFLLLEARRLCFYNLWQQRVLLLERGLIQPALWSLAADETGGGLDEADFRAALDPQLGRTVPTMRLRKAVARRLRRVYLYLIGVQLLAWGVKLASHPVPASSFSEIAARAQVWALPGWLVLVLVLVSLLVVVSIAAALGGRDRTPSDEAKVPA